MLRAAVPMLCWMLLSCGSVVPLDKSQMQTPDGAFEYFKNLLARGEYGKAHLLLSKQTRQHLQAEPFALAFVSYPTLRRLVLASEVRDLQTRGERGVITIHNPLLGIDRTIGLRKEFGRIWTLDLSRSDMEEMVEIGEEWVFAQFEASGGYHVFPPDHDFTPLTGR